MHILALNTENPDGTLYDFDAFKDPPIPCLVRIGRIGERPGEVELSLVAGVMEDLRVEDTGGYRFLVGDLKCLETPAVRTLSTWAAVICVPVGHWKSHADGTRVPGDFVLKGCCIQPAPLEWSIRNHLDVEVDVMIAESEGAALAQYAVKVEVKSSFLIETGYKVRLRHPRLRRSPPPKPC